MPRATLIAASALDPSGVRPEHACMQPLFHIQSLLTHFVHKLKQDHQLTKACWSRAVFEFSCPGWIRWVGGRHERVERSTDPPPQPERAAGRAPRRAEHCRRGPIPTMLAAFERWTGQPWHSLIQGKPTFSRGGAHQCLAAKQSTAQDPSRMRAPARGRGGFGRGVWVEERDAFGLFLERVVRVNCSLLRPTAVMHGSAGECFEPEYWVARPAGARATVSHTQTACMQAPLVVALAVAVAAVVAVALVVAAVALADVAVALVAAAGTTRARPSLSWRLAPLSIPARGRRC